MKKSFDSRRMLLALNLTLPTSWATHELYNFGKKENLYALTNGSPLFLSIANASQAIVPSQWWNTELNPRQMDNDSDIIFGTPIHHLSQDQLLLLSHLSRTFVPASHMNYYTLPGDWSTSKYEVMQGKTPFYPKNLYLSSH